jgi:hypothetical protein
MTGTPDESRPPDQPRLPLRRRLAVQRPRCGRGGRLVVHSAGGRARGSRSAVLAPHRARQRSWSTLLPAFRCVLVLDDLQDGDDDQASMAFVSWSLLIRPRPKLHSQRLRWLPVVAHDWPAGAAQNGQAIAWTCHLSGRSEVSGIVELSVLSPWPRWVPRAAAAVAGHVAARLIGWQEAAGGDAGGDRAALVKKPKRAQSVRTFAVRRRKQRLSGDALPGKTAAHVAEARGFEPRMGANPNRISSAAP